MGGNALLHAMRADDAGLEVVATAAPRED